MASIIELLFVLLSALGFGLIPFAGPSNLFIASNWVLVLGVTDPPTLVAIGFLVAIGASVAKSVHYMVTFFVSQHLSEKRRMRLDAEAQKVKRWAFLLLFLAAATPIPDEPVVIPLGLMKYSLAKFFTAFFLGKLSITVAGAFLVLRHGRTVPARLRTLHREKPSPGQVGRQPCRVALEQRQGAPGWSQRWHRECLATPPDCRRTLERAS